MYKFRTNWCSVCKQGWVEIVQDESTKQLFVYCNECETEWSHPENAIKNLEGSQDRYGSVQLPKYADIVNLSWENYLLKE